MPARSDMKVDQHDMSLEWAFNESFGFTADNNVTYAGMRKHFVDLMHPYGAAKDIKQLAPIYEYFGINDFREAYTEYHNSCIPAYKLGKYNSFKSDLTQKDIWIQTRFDMLIEEGQAACVAASDTKIFDIANKLGLIEFNYTDQQVLDIYRRFHHANKHKMKPIPVCKIPEKLK